MDLFDDIIAEIRAWFRKRAARGAVRKFDLSRRIDAPPEPGGAMSRPAAAGIILKEDAHLELGHPKVGSCSATLATNDPFLVQDGMVTLVGPDIAETDERALPFAQIVVAACNGGDVGELSRRMDRRLYLSVQTEGYMIRSVHNRIWARVSRQAVARGFCFQHLGLALMRSIREAFAGVEAVEVFFATGGVEDVAALGVIVERAAVKQRKIRDFRPAKDGAYECVNSLDCSECPEQTVCNTIRDVIRIRKRDRVVAFEPAP